MGNCRPFAPRIRPFPMAMLFILCGFGGWIGACKFRGWWFKIV
jgi:hypothetical protein